MTRPPRRLAGAALVVGVLAAWPLGSDRLSAWGAQGHHIVARIAWARMTDRAREEATTLLGGGMDEFVSSATWADDVRPKRPETFNWHFVDIPSGVTRYNQARDCRPSDKGD